MTMDGTNKSAMKSDSSDFGPDVEKRGLQQVISYGDGQITHIDDSNGQFHRSFSPHQVHVRPDRHSGKSFPY
jgi:hypothetical protein